MKIAPLMIRILLVGVRRGEMKALDVIKLASLYLGQKDLLSTTTLGGEVAPTEAQTQNLDTLLDCVNDVTETIAILYFPLTYEETVSSTTGIINFSSFSKAVCDIDSVTDKCGFSVDFQVFPTYIKTTAGQHKVVYHYLPERVTTFASDIEICMEKVSLRLMVLGVVSRYYLMQGMFSEAQAWQTVFDNTALGLKHSRKNQVIKKRRWL